MSRKASRERAPVRRKVRRKGTIRAGKRHTPAKAQAKEVIADLVDANARALGIPLDAPWHGGVAFNLGLILRLAVLVDQFPLPDDTEPGPVFHA